jgi:nucleoside-diphosphate-sugar epimerase
LELGRTTVLVTGATGFIGSAVALHLQQLGYGVRVFCRSPERLPQVLVQNGAEIITGDLQDPDAIRRAADSATGGLVVHLAAATSGDWDHHWAVTVQGTRQLLDASRKANVLRFVHVSSMSVYDYSALPAGLTLSETGPLERDTSRRNAYARAKSEADMIVRDSLVTACPEVCILRPGIVYGAGGRMPLITTLKRLQGSLYMSIGGGQRLLPLTYIDNLVDAVLLALRHPRAAGRIFNVVDDVDIPTERRYLEDLFSIQRRPFHIIGLPVGPFLALAQCADLIARFRRQPDIGLTHGLRRVTRPVAFSASLLREELGWRPRIGFSEGLVRTISAGS